MNPTIVPDQTMTCIPLHKTWQMNPTLANEPPRVPEQRLQPCIPLHQTWQMKLLWSMNPPVPEQRWLAYHYTKPGRWTYFGQWTSTSTRAEMTCITTTQNLADEPTLANGAPSTRAEMTCIPLAFKTSADEPTLANGPSSTHFCLESDLHTTARAPEISGRWTYFRSAWTQWQRFESSSVHHFWDTPQHFLKTQFT